MYIHADLAGLFHELTRPDESLSSAEQARDASAKLIEDDPNNIYNVILVGLASDRMGGSLSLLGRRDEATSAFDHALAQHEQASAKSPDLFDARLYLAVHYLGLARAHREWKEPAESAAAVRKFAELFPMEPTRLVTAARAFALSIPLVAKGKDTLNAGEQKERQSYADEAMSAIRLAVANGYNDIERLGEIPDLAPLQSRDDFRELLAK